MTLDLTVWRTPQLLCPACQEQRLHQASERTDHHPLAGHGFNGTRWTHPTLESEKRMQAAASGGQP